MVSELLPCESFSHVQLSRARHREGPQPWNTTLFCIKVCLENSKFMNFNIQTDTKIWTESEGQLQPRSNLLLFTRKVTQINGGPNCLKSPNLTIITLCTKLSMLWAGLSVFTFSKASYFNNSHQVSSLGRTTQAQFPLLASKLEEPRAQADWSRHCPAGLAFVYVTYCLLICLLARLIQSCRLFATLWTIAHWAPVSMRFSRQEYWSGLPCPPPGDLPNSGIKPTCLTSVALIGGFFTTSASWEAHVIYCHASKASFSTDFTLSPSIEEEWSSKLDFFSKSLFNVSPSLAISTSLAKRC